METRQNISLDTEEILRDYTLAVQSREASVIGRREVMSGKAKFGIFGDGKEVPQLALAKVFQPGDWRSGYYRDQTLMLALGIVTIREFFAQLYAHADSSADPHSAGRQMNSHFATRTINPDGSWTDLTAIPQTSADVSPTAAQMPRLVGLGYASRLYRELEELHQFTQFSDNGNEIAFGTIGNASCAEGLFWESINAIGVLKSPVVMSIWDDEYGISVHNEHQITKQDLSVLLSGFQREPGTRDGFDVYTVRGWDYLALIDTYQRAAEVARTEHVPSIVHVIEVTQPQGHSTSGSHERYKSAERLGWEQENDCNRKLRDWMIQQGVATVDELNRIDTEAREYVEHERAAAWEAVASVIADERTELADLLQAVEQETGRTEAVAKIGQSLRAVRQPLRRDVMSIARRAAFATRGEDGPARRRLKDWTEDYEATNRARYGQYLFSEGEYSALNVPEVKAIYASDAPDVTGFQVINANFDVVFANNPRVIAFGEDVGKLGDVNQGFAGLQEKHGTLRISDTGIREATIIGQAIGMAMRGLRPIAEIQYLDYLLYALQIMSDDLATVYWRSAGAQKAPVIVRTRGHRLEGIWHSGSPMGGILHLLRGMHILVPRNMTQAAGFYNTLLQAEEPALVVEVLNAYRLKEKLPQNVGEFTIPLGVPEVLRQGKDMTVVTYGASIPIALEAASLLSDAGIEIELIDVRSLLPFDVNGMILTSLKKTSRIIFLDEDVPGGASAYMMQQVIERQGGYQWLDSEPRTLSAQAHRPAYGSDGNYFSKPNVEDIIEMVYSLMREADPGHFPAM
jgi:pyruvate/2-oxoglutarate/acetoin dehydrogenase E1 component/TPP-dependent pyruvate/acetoin dehydrogenase alpha subunit